MINGKINKKVCELAFLCMLIMAFSRSQAQFILEQEKQWVDSVFSNMSVEDKIGQLILLKSSSEHPADFLMETITEFKPGGLIVENVQFSRPLIAKLSHNQDIPMLFGVEGDNFLKQYGINDEALLATRGKQVISKLGRLSAHYLHNLGVHFFIAPGLFDILQDSSSQENRELVGEKSRFLLKGLKEGGLVPVLSGFPLTQEPSISKFNDFPVIPDELSVFKKNHLHEYLQLMNEGINAIQTETFYAPNISDDNLPITLDPVLMDDFLTGYKQNILLTENLSKPAITAHFRKGEPGELSIKAGHDILVDPDDLPATFRKLRRALKKEEIRMSKVDSSVRKILHLKYQQIISNTSDPIDTTRSYAALEKSINDVSTDVLVSSAILLKNEGTPIPFETLEDKHFTLLDLRPESGGDLLNTLRKYTRVDYYSSYDSETFEKLNHYDEVVVVANTLESPVLLVALEDLSKMSNVTIIISGPLGQLSNTKRFKNVAWIPSSGENSGHLLPQLLFGAKAFKGQLPVSYTEYAFGTGKQTKNLERLGYATPEEMNFDARHLNEVDSIMYEAIRNKATPGAQLIIARRGKIVWEKAYGYQTYDSLQPVEDFTLYDLASITKVAASVQALMFLYERGIIDLDKKVSFYLPELKGSNKENMILRDILTHQAGLWPYLPFWRETLNEMEEPSPDYYSFHPEFGFFNEVSPGLYTSKITADSVWQWVISSKLRDKEPDTPYDYKYSDMGYYIIQKMVERIINQPMEDFLNQNLYDPMGMTSMDYHPLCQFPQYCIAPTEEDTYFRYDLISGTVHDQGAALLGGVAGHAGLFSNAIDLAKLMQLMLQKGYYGGKRYFQPETIELFTSKQYNNNRRGLGWDKPLTDEWGGPTSELASGKTFGHTGFTGTAAWVDPEFDLVYIFLSNRIHPDATNTELITSNVRTRIQDVIYQALFKGLQYEDIQ